MFESQEWRFALAEFHGDHSQRPDVNFLIVAFFFDKFWGHPCRSSDNRLAIKLAFGKLDGEPKISNLDITVKTEQDIITFKITMELFPLMQGLESFEHFFHEIGNDIFGYFFHVMVNKISHGAAIHKLNKHEEGLFVVVSEEILGQVFASTHGHDGDFSPDFL
jgi:hypothetical protein